jgi:hypothetical protein
LVTRAQRDPAWEFRKTKDHSRLKRRIQYELREESESMTFEIERIEYWIEQWSRPRNTRSTRAEDSRTSAGKDESPRRNSARRKRAYQT